MTYKTVGFVFNANDCFRERISNGIVFDSQEDCLKMKLSYILSKHPGFKVKENAIVISPQEIPNIHQLFLPDNNSDIALQKTNEDVYGELCHHFINAINGKVLKVLI